MFDEGVVVAAPVDGCFELSRLTEADIDAMSQADLEALYARLVAAADTPRVPDPTGWDVPLPVTGVIADRLATVAGVSMADRVRMMKAHARLVAHHQARLMEAMAGLVDDYERYEWENDESGEGDLEAAFEGAVAEIRAALSVTRRAAETDLTLASLLVDRLPRVWQALCDGRLDVRRAREIAYGTGHLDEATARAVADRVLERCEGLTAGQVKGLVRRLCVETNPEDAKNRYARAVDERRVTAELTEDGTGSIFAWDLPAEQVAFVMNRIEALAHDLNTKDEARSIDQLRADIFVDLLAGHVSQRQARIDVTVDLATLTGLAEHAGELEGMGPVISDIVRDVANTYGSQWRYAVTDPASGHVLVAGTLKRRPTAVIRRAVEMRDRTCVFPGCRRPARRSDLDHTTPYAQGGETTVASLAACCRHDHVIRHHFNWSYVRNPDGSYTWTAPSGIQYTRPPP